MPDAHAHELVQPFAGVCLVSNEALRSAGALAAAAVGAATLAASLRCGATLLAFYAASSRLTAYREQAKAVDDDFKPGGQRDWVQVASLIRLGWCRNLEQSH